MATTQEKIDADRHQKTSEAQTNSESINPKRSSGRNIDSGENELSNGTQSGAPAPGIATVGNTGAETSE